MGFLEGMDFGDVLQAGAHGFIEADIRARDERTKAVRERVKQLTNSLIKQQETAHAAAVKAHQERQTKAEAIKATGGDDLAIGLALGYDYDDIKDMKQRQKDSTKPLWTAGDLDAWVGNTPKYTLPRNITTADIAKIRVGTDFGDQVRGLFGAEPQGRDTAESVLQRSNVSLTPDTYTEDRGGSLVSPTGGEFDWDKKKKEKPLAIDIRLENFEQDWEEEYGFTGFPNEEKLAIAINSGTVAEGTSLTDLKTIYKKEKQIALLGTRPTTATSNIIKVGTIKKMYVGGAKNQDLQYTGNPQDVYQGHVGWVPWGQEEPITKEGKDQFQTIQLDDHTTLKLLKTNNDTDSVTVGDRTYRGWVPFGSPKQDDPSGFYHVTATAPDTGETIVKFFKPERTDDGGVNFREVARERGKVKLDKIAIPQPPNEAERKEVMTFLDNKVNEDSEVGKVIDVLASWDTDNRGNASSDSRKYAANFNILRNDIATIIKQRQYNARQIGQEYHFTGEHFNSVLTELYENGAFNKEVDDDTGWGFGKRPIYTRIPEPSIYPIITRGGLSFVTTSECMSNTKCQKQYFPR